MTTTTTAPTRSVGGVPHPGQYEIDPAHSSISFLVPYVGISNVRGRFTDFQGTISVAELPLDSTTRVSIQAASIDTGQSRRDAHLRSPDFFDVDRYPTLEFASTGLEAPDSEWRLQGDLTITGTTLPVTLSLAFIGTGPDPAGDPRHPRIGFAATTTVDREDFGITWNHVLDKGALLIGRTVRIELDVQAFLLAT